MNNKKFCPTQDYDFYTIKLPLKALKKGRRTRFLNSELGKLHPCFSDDCCFDSRLKLDKSGLKADVVVMQKFTLAEYKNANGQKPVFIKEKGRIPFFKISAVRIRDRRIFVCICFFVVLCVIFYRKALGGQGKKNGMSVAVKAVSESEENVIQEDVLKSFVAGDLLDAVAQLNGIVSSFEWKLDGFVEKINICTKGVYPEDISKLFPEAVFSPVVFEKTVPVLTIEIKSKIFSDQKIDHNAYEQYPFENPEFKAKIRAMINSNGLNIVEETVRPYSFKIQFEQSSNTIQDAQQKALIKIFDFFKENELCINSLTIISDAGNFNLSIVFSEICFDFQTQIYESLCRNAEVFFEYKENNQLQVQKNNLNKSFITQKNENKIGQIQKADGTVFEFYKDENGKIRRRIK